MSKIFTKVSKEQIITLLQQYNLPVSFLPITPSIVSGYRATTGESTFSEIFF